MADEIHHPHDMMIRAVLSDLAEATSFLQRHLPDEVSQGLNWSTLRLVEGSFVDENLRGSEADLLYEVEQVLSQDVVWLYILLEHQSTPDRWMWFRLLKYCCRIWDQSFREQPEQKALRAIVPLVFYQGERHWSYSREFADLCAESVRAWPGGATFCPWADRPIRHATGGGSGRSQSSDHAVGDAGSVSPDVDLDGTGREIAGFAVLACVQR
jgi:hypothetical protein